MQDLEYKSSTFGIRRGFFEAYSHSLPIPRSLGSASCQDTIDTIISKKGLKSKMGLTEPKEEFKDTHNQLGQTNKNE